MFEKLLEAIKARNMAEAQKLIAQMNTAELSKVDSYSDTALTYAASKGLDKVCEMLILPEIIQVTSIIQEESLYKILKKINNKLKNDDGLAEDNKILRQSIVANIITEVSKLTNESDIKKITTSVKDLLNGRITKTKLKDIKEDVDYLIKQQSKLGYDVTVNKVEEIIYDKPLLNHPKLLQAAVESKLSSDLIQEAINNNDEELILAGLLSMGYDATQIN